MQSTKEVHEMATKRHRIMGATAAVVAGTLTLGLAGDAFAGRPGDHAGERSRSGETTAETGIRAGRPVQPGKPARTTGANGANGANASAAATPALEDALRLAMTDEMTALATYEAFAEVLESDALFARLARSEARHLASLERLADRYGIDIDVVRPDVDPATNMDDACAAAAAIEEADIALYDELLPELQDWPSVVRVLTNLQRASEQHLAAVTSCDVS
jgi:rubrerythrin